MYTDAAFGKENSLKSYIIYGSIAMEVYNISVSSEICTIMYKQRRSYRYLKQTTESQALQNYAHFSRTVNNFMREI
jgi:hypothetical protein